LKIITVGMLRMPYSVATLGDSSVFSFTCTMESIARGESERFYKNSADSFGAKSLG
jgi:hypothetical protein